MRAIIRELCLENTDVFSVQQSQPLEFQCILHVNLPEECPKTLFILNRSITPFFNKLKFKLLNLLIQTCCNLALPYPQCFFQPSFWLLECFSLPFQSTPISSSSSLLPSWECAPPPPPAHSCIFLPSLHFCRT